MQPAGAATAENNPAAGSSGGEAAAPAAEGPGGAVAPEPMEGVEQGPGSAPHVGAGMGTCRSALTHAAGVAQWWVHACRPAVLLCCGLSLVQAVPSACAPAAV